MGVATKPANALEKPKIDWTGKMWQLVLETKERMREQGLTHPTVRTYWYRFWSTYQVIPGTEQTYKLLDALTVKMRKAGAIEFGYFPVKRGETYGGDHAEWLIRDYIDYLKRQLLNAHRDYHMPRWLWQPIIVEVWVEKVGHGPQISEWVEDLNVKVRANQGYGTWEFIHTSMQDLKAQLADGTKRKVVIIYLGDLDPSGTDIDRALLETMQFFGIHPEFIRLALNPDQVRDYSLPSWPEKRETLQKIENDLRYRAYLEKYGKVACELDSLLDKAPEQLQQLLRFNIQRYFDREIHEIVQEEESKAQAEIEKTIKELTATWNHKGEAEQP